MMRIALTGGIACGKSLVAKFLNEFGVDTIDADDIVHDLIPAGERKRIAEIVFKNAEERRALEARIHPLVRARIDEAITMHATGIIIAIIPLLFETHWDEEYDIICTVSSERQTQISRMMNSRGYSREMAEARLVAQLPVAEKVAKSQYVINNDGSLEELKQETERFVIWLKNLTYSQTH